ncbi:hypothetical protein PRIC1_005681 [Phytophthora ramorum]
MDASLVANEVESGGCCCPQQPSAFEMQGQQEVVFTVCDEPEQFNFHRSFGFMTGRRLQRRYRGVYKKYSLIGQVVTWITAIYIIAVFAILAAGDSASSDSRWSVADSAFYFVMVAVGVHVIAKLALIIRFVVYWIVIAELLTYAITGDPYAMFEDDKYLDSNARKVRYRMIIALFSVEIITVAAYWFTHYAYPWMVLKQKFNLVKWWNIKPGVETNSITYRSRARFYTRKRNVIKYCGGLNAHGQPHGYGMWTDTAYHGERLTGQWEDGVPIGPFRSFEHGSGYSFVNIRIGFCHNRGEKGPTEIHFFPKHAENGLNWGVASVECSVSGGFFKYLPTVTHVTPSYVPEAPQNAAECLPALRTPTDGVVFNHKDEEAMLCGNHQTDQMRDRNLVREQSTPLHGLRSSGSVADDKEALVLLHGYNCSLDISMNRLAQLLALGDFPSYIHPFVFSWPSGGVLAYFQAKQVGCESARTRDDFIKFLRSLIEAGYTKLNIVAHSMGARIFFNCLSQGCFEEVFVPIATTSNSNLAVEKIRLVSLTLCNPDYGLNEFVTMDGAFDRARHFCSLITLYADTMDGALFHSEYLTKTSLAGPLNYSLGRRGYMVHRDPRDSENAEQPHMLFNNRTSSTFSPSQDAAANQSAKYPGVTSIAYNRSRFSDATTTFGSTRSEEEGDPLHYLDMDVIDTTWMDNNVHSIRHSYFNLNPTIVDDLRQLIVLKKRASSRPGLLKTTSAENVYIFLVAPSHVKNN